MVTWLNDAELITPSLKYQPIGFLQQLSRLLNQPVALGEPIVTGKQLSSTDVQYPVRTKDRELGRYVLLYTGDKFNSLLINKESLFVDFEAPEFNRVVYYGIHPLIPEDKIPPPYQKIGLANFGSANYVGIVYNLKERKVSCLVNGVDLPHQLVFPGFDSTYLFKLGQVVWVDARSFGGPVFRARILDRMKRHDQTNCYFVSAFANDLKGQKLPPLDEDKLSLKKPLKKLNR